RPRPRARRDDLRLARLRPVRQGGAGPHAAGRGRGASPRPVRAHRDRAGRRGLGRRPAGPLPLARGIRRDGHLTGVPGAVAPPHRGARRRPADSDDHPLTTPTYPDAMMHEHADTVSPHSPATVAVTAGRPPRVQGGPVNAPVVLSSTYVSQGVPGSE